MAGQRSRSELSTITIGHQAHGKTTLVAAMMRTLGGGGGGYSDVNKAPAREVQGVKLQAAHVQLDTSSRRYNHTDCPSGNNTVKNLMIGETPLDGAILVVSAIDGPQAQTREHVMLARQVGVPHIVVFLSKCDLLDNEELVEIVEPEIRELLSTYGFSGEDTPIVRGNALSALEGKGEAQKAISKLIDQLDSYLPDPSIAGQSSAKSCKELKAEVYLLTKDEGGRTTPVNSSWSAQFGVRGTNTDGTIELPEGLDAFPPGDHMEVSVTFKQPVSVDKGTRFTITENAKTVVLGVVVRIVA